MRFAVFLCCFILLSSCQWFSSKEAKTEQLVDEKMLTIDWTDVDQYPLFEQCDELATKPGQKTCFENTLLSHFAQSLKEHDWVPKTDIKEAIYVDFLIDKEGAISVLNIEENELLNQQFPKFNTIITQCLTELPHTEPALKRGIPVAAKFRIPLIINTK